MTPYPTPRIPHIYRCDEQATPLPLSEVQLRVKQPELWEWRHKLIEEVDELERALVTPPRGSSARAAGGAGAPRLGGAGLASGGRRADA